MVTFLVVLLMVYTFRNLLGTDVADLMLRTSTREINDRQTSPARLSVSGFEKRGFLNFIADTMN